MGHAYTPGLRVADRAVVVKERILPIPGEVLVKEGDRVRAEDLVARTQLPGKVHSVNVVNLLGITASEIGSCMLKRVGEPVAKGEALAETRPWLRFLRTSVDSPIDGTVETASEVTGQVMLRHPPRELELRAYLDGEVTEVREGEGVTIRTTAAFVQGIFGIGGETHGELVTAVQDPGEELDASRITSDHAGKVLIGGAHAGADVFQAAREHGVAGIVVGAIHDRDLKELLGRDLGVAITGSEDVGFTLVVTEGFGRLPMAPRTYELLAGHAGRRASMNGATQIRAGVLRPEVIVPEIGDARKDRLRKPAGDAGGENWERGALKQGDTIRIIRAPFFGELARVADLPKEPAVVESGATVRVLVAELPDGREAVVPRANVELIEG